MKIEKIPSKVDDFSKLKKYSLTSLTSLTVQMSKTANLYYSRFFSEVSHSSYLGPTEGLVGKKPIRI